MVKKALILFSGGIDSSVLLWWAKAKKWNCSTLSFLFSGRRKNEIKAASELRKKAGCKHHLDIMLSFLEPPKASRSCYIPQRNLMYYGMAASFAEKIEADFILGGHIGHDGKVFTDATKKYFNQIEKLIQSSSKNKKLKLVFPFIDWDKKDIMHLGLKLKLPFNLTWSCSNNGNVHCWKCNSCKERLQGFTDAGISDPLFTN